MAEKKTPTIYEQLAKIQKELVAPKGQYNSFSKFKYRSCEDIVEAVKPLLGNLVLTLDDDIQVAGDRYYVRATAVVANGDERISTAAFAREALTKKGMDEAQITGSASSYARKYALNGLFAIDDTKDADTKEEVAKPTTLGGSTITAKQKQFFAVAHEAGLYVEKAKDYVRDAYKVKSFNDLTLGQLIATVDRIRNLDSATIKRINSYGDDESVPAADIFDGTV